MFLLVLTAFMAQGQEEKKEVVTAFKKDLWLTSLEGTISSSNSTLGNNTNFNTAYGLNISSNKIFKDRWAGGLRLTAQRESSNSFIVRESESIFLGPNLAYYFSKSTQGSLFVEFSPGYVRFFESSESNSGLITAQESVDGNGFGTVFRFGYAHVINERVIFNFGMNVTNFWINAERITEPGPTSSRKPHHWQPGL